jgi:hypothetical protein
MNNIPTQINPQIFKSLFSNFWEALQFEAAVPKLHTFHMDLHPPTHVQLKIPNFRCLGYAAPKPLR